MEVELIKENAELKEKLRQQDEEFKQEKAKWEQHGLNGNSQDVQIQLRELRAQVVSLKSEKSRIIDDRDKVEALFRKKIESLEQHASEFHGNQKAA